MTIPHLDDETLSAVLDGEATAAEQAHLSSCSRCQGQLESLASVARLVATPVPPPPAAVVDDAIRRAVGSSAPDRTVAPVGGEAAPAGGEAGAVGGEAGAVGGEAAASGGEAAAPYPPRDSTAQATPSRATPGPRPGRAGAPRWLVPAGAVAAAILVVGLVVSVLPRSAHETASTAPLGSATSVAGPGSATNGQSGSSTVPAASSTAVAGDLGDQRDAAVVAQIVQSALAASGPEQRLTHEPSPLAPAPPPPCVSEARVALGGAVPVDAAVRYAATLRWQGQPGVVVVFARPGGVAGVIMKAGDCSVLARLPL